MKSDSELIKETLAGDLDAFSFLVQRYERLVRATAMHLCHDKHAAEDISQEAFCTAFESLDKLQHPQKFGGWLLSIAKHKTARHVRAVPNREQSLLDEEAVGGLGEDRLSSVSEELLALVERLPEHERVIVGFRHFEGHSIQDITEITGRPVGTITKQLSRAYDRLRHWAKKEIHR